MGKIETMTAVGLMDPRVAWVGPGRTPDELSTDDRVWLSGHTTIGRRHAVASHTVPCPETNPCVAVRQGNQVALVRSGIVYRIDTSQRFSNRSFMLDDRARARVLDRAHPDDHVVSLGGDVLTVARRVR